MMVNNLLKKKNTLTYLGIVVVCTSPIIEVRGRSIFKLLFAVGNRSSALTSMLTELTGIVLKNNILLATDHVIT